MRQAYMYMAFSVLTWSVFPLFLNWGVETVDPVFFVLLIQVFAGLSSAVCGILLIKEKDRFWQLTKNIKKYFNTDLVLLGLGCGAASLCYNLCFAYAIIYTPEMSATVILEAWPIHAIYLSYFLIKKDWQAMDREDMIIGALSIVGFAVIFVGTQTGETSWNINFEAALGCFLALIGALSLAFSTLIRARLGQEIEPLLPFDKNKEKKMLASMFLGEVIARLFTLPFIGMSLFAHDVSYDIGIDQIAMALIIGVVIYNFGTVAYSMATLKSHSPTIHLSWFVMCVLSIIWLQLSGEDTINPTVILGMICIMIGNVGLTIKSFKGNKGKTIPTEVNL